jgi:glycerate 2-kinase
VLYQIIWNCPIFFLWFILFHLSALILGLTMVLNPPKDQLRHIFQAALQAVDPYQSTARYQDEILTLYEKGRCHQLFVLGFGKAVSPMFQAITDRMGERITKGVIITKYGHLTQADIEWPIQFYEAGHPLPDENGRRATGEAIKLLREADERTLIICLISGGGSALLVAPFGDISLPEKQTITDLLLKAGADIDELNTVRKHISRVKGGRLAEMASPGRIKSLILSDVIHNRLDVIASGPTAPDGTTYGEALQILGKYGLAAQIPESVLDVLTKGHQGIFMETPKEGNPLFQKVDNTIIGGNQDALDAAKNEAARLGYETEIISAEIRGEAREVGRWLGQKALRTLETIRSTSKRKACLISGGETTVTVTGKGKGGRNMELALAFAREVAGCDGISLLSAGTDGTDGPTDAAGAIIDDQTIIRARARGLDSEATLRENNSYHFFRQTGELLITGPTHTNVMDMQIILLQI